MAGRLGASPPGGAPSTSTDRRAGSSRVRAEPRRRRHAPASPDPASAAGAPRRSRSTKSRRPRSTSPGAAMAMPAVPGSAGSAPSPSTVGSAWEPCPAVRLRAPGRRSGGGRRAVRPREPRTLGGTSPSLVGGSSSSGYVPTDLGLYQLAGRCLSRCNSTAKSRARQRFGRSQGGSLEFRPVDLRDGPTGGNTAWAGELWSARRWSGAAVAAVRSCRRGTSTIAFVRPKHPTSSAPRAPATSPGGLARRWWPRDG